MSLEHQEGRLMQGITKFPLCAKKVNNFLIDINAKKQIIQTPSLIPCITSNTM